MCLVVTCWERADLLALVCGGLLWVCHFHIDILGQLWYLIVSIPDLCTHTYFSKDNNSKNKNNFVMFSPGNLLIIFYQLTKIGATSCNSLSDIFITIFQ